MEDNTPERLDKSLTRLEMAHQLSETAELILADVNKLVANGDGIVDEAVNITLKDAGKIRKHATAIRYGISEALENADAHESNEERKRRFIDNLLKSSDGE